MIRIEKAARAPRWATTWIRSSQLTVRESRPVSYESRIWDVEDVLSCVAATETMNLHPRSLLAGPLRRLRFRAAKEHRRVRLFELGSVGSDVRLTGWVDFGSEPFLIHLGSDITVSGGVAFITHDGGVRVLRRRHPRLHVYDEIVVGDRVFIGMGSTILPGVTIGSDVVIGAGSVVTRDVPPGMVAAGVPCRPIRPLAEYEESSLARGMDWTVGDYGEAWRHAVIAAVEHRRDGGDGAS